ITYDRAKSWGLLGWARQIIPVMMDSVSEAVDYELDAIVGRSAHKRLQPRIDVASPEMDDVRSQNLEALELQAQRFIGENKAVIADVAATLSSGRGSDLPGIGR